MILKITMSEVLTIDEIDEYVKKIKGIKSYITQSQRTCENCGSCDSFTKNNEKMTLCTQCGCVMEYAISRSCERDDPCWKCGKVHDKEYHNKDCEFYYYSCWRCGQIHEGNCKSHIQ